MKNNKGDFIFNDSKRKYSLRKISGIGVVSALIGIMSFSSVISNSVSASEADINVKYHYVSTDELSKEEMNLVVNELPKDLVDGSNLFVVYKINSNASLPNTGSTALNLASIIGAGLVLIGYKINKSGDKKKRIVKNILLISLVGGAFTVKSVSAFTISSLANYNHIEKISVGMSIPDGKINIPGYHFVGYIDEKNVNFADNTITNISKEDTVNSVNEVSSVETQQSVQTSESENSKESVTKANQEETVKETLLQQDNQKNEEKKPIEHTSKINNEMNYFNLNYLYDNGGKNSNTKKNSQDGESSKTNNNIQPKVIKRVIKVDEEGKTIENITGYTKIFEDQPVETKEIIDGQETTVLTIKEHYKAEKVINEKHPIDSKLTNVAIPTKLVEILSEEIVDNVTENVNKEVKEDKEGLKDSEDNKVTELIETSLNTSTNKVEKATMPNNESGTNIHSTEKTISVTEEKEEKKETNSPTEKVALNNVDKKENITVVENNTSKPKENNEVSKPANNIVSIIKKEEPKTNTQKVVRMVRTTEEIPFKLTVKEDNTLAEGESRIEAEGKLGKKTTIHKITLVNNIEEKKETLLETIEEAENRVIVVGTKKNNAASNVNKEEHNNDASHEENKVESNQTLPKTDYTVEITNSKNNTIIKNREEIAEIVKNRNLSLNLEKPDKDKSIQTKVIEIKDNTLEEGKRQLQDIQASYVTVNVRKKEDNLNNNEKNELVTSLDIPLITKVYHVGTKNINFPRKDIVVSGHVYDSKREAVENATVGVYKDDKLISNVNTDVDGYTFTHLLSNQTYVLKSKDFEAKIITITNSEPIVQNITGKFELGKKYSDDMVNYHLKSNVINVDDGQYQTNTDDGKKVVLSKEIDARVGDILVIPPSKIYETPKAIKVTSVNHVNNETVIEYSTPSLYEVINNISTKSWETEISRGVFIPADGVKVERKNNSDGSLFRSITIESSVAPATLNLSIEKDIFKVEGKIDFRISGGLSSDEIDLNFLSTKIDFMNLNIKSYMKFKTEGSVSVKLTKEQEKRYLNSNPTLSLPLKIGRIVVPTSILGVNIIYDLTINTTFEGEATISASSAYSIENSFLLKNWNNKQENKKSHEFIIDKVEVKGSSKIGPKLSVSPGVLDNALVSISAEAGIGAEISTSESKEIIIEPSRNKNDDEGIANETTNNSVDMKKNKKELSIKPKEESGIEVFGYLTLKSKLDLLKMFSELGEMFSDLNYEFTLFDGKIAIDKKFEKINNEEISEGNNTVNTTNNDFSFLEKGFNYYNSNQNSITNSDLWIEKDGTIKGISYSIYSDYDAFRPTRKLYVNDFYGKFVNLTKVSDYEYKMKLNNLSYLNPGAERIINGIRVINTHPLGLIDKEFKEYEFTIYLPGKNVDELPKGIGDSIINPLILFTKKLQTIIIYNKELGTTFVEFREDLANNYFAEDRKYVLDKWIKNLTR